MRALRALSLIVAILAAAALPAAAGATSIRWNKAVRLVPSSHDGGLSAVSCPTTRLCVAVDQAGYVITTTRPTGGKGSWSKAARIDRAPLTGVACPTTRLCVATDANGSVLTSTKPTGGARAWSRPGRVDSAAGPDGAAAGLEGVACPSTSLCVAVDGASPGNVVSTTSPAKGSRTWKVTKVGGTLTSIACASAAMCVAAGSQHYVSTSPAGNSSAWHATGGQTGGGILSAIACPALTLCVGVGYGNTSTGLATVSANPRGTARTWRTVSVEPTPPDPGEGLLTAVGCAGRAICVAVDGNDHAFVSTSPTTGAWSGPVTVRPKSASSTTAISCNRQLCAVVDSAGVETTGVVR